MQDSQNKLFEIANSLKKEHIYKTESQGHLKFAGLDLYNGEYTLLFYRPPFNAYAEKVYMNLFHLEMQGLDKFISKARAE